LKNAILYNRRSRGLLEDLQKFKAEMMDYCKKNKFKPTYFEEIASSVDEERVEYNKFVKEIETGKFQVLVITDLSRLTRDLEQQLRLFKILNKNNMIIHSLLDGIIDPKERTGKIMSGIKGLFNEIAYDEISQKMHLGRFQSAKEGKWVNAPPFGYRKNKETMKLVPDPIEAPVLKRIFNEVIEGYSTTNISLRLHQDGIKTRLGNHWHPSTVSNTLERRAYLGETKFKSEVFGDEVYLKDTHEPLVSLEDFMKVREILANKQHFRTRTHGITSPLDKLIICGYCGRMMQINYVNERRYIHLTKCNAYKYGERCNNSGVAIHVLLPRVYEEIRKRKQIMKDQLLQLEQGGTSNRIERLNMELKGLQKELKNTESEKDDLLNYLLKKIINEVVYTSKNQELENKIKQLQQRIDDTLEAIASTNIDNDVDYIQGLLGHIEHIETQPVDEQNRILRQVIEKIVYIRERNDVQMEFHFK
jgi:site-specific DNA recombinase